MLGQQQQASCQVNVEVDAGPAQDLNSRLAEIREQYEQAAAKSQKDLNAWFEDKVGTLSAGGTLSTGGTRPLVFRVLLSRLRRRAEVLILSSFASDSTRRRRRSKRRSQ